MFSGGLKLSDDDEEDFNFIPEKGVNNLSNIFGVKVESIQQEEAPSLRYVSPKPPAKEPAAENSANDWKVQVAKVVTAYKLLNQENISQGRIGLAVLKNAEKKLRIILYRSKNNVLSTCTFKYNTIIYRNDLYLQFHDDLQLFWSVLFETKDMDEVLNLIESKICTRPELQAQQSCMAVAPEKVIEQQLEQSIESLPLPDPNSSDEQLKETKASILSRMAKMGQALPKMTTQATTTDLSDSSDNETNAKVLQKPMVVSRKPKLQPLVPFGAAQMIPSNAISSYIPSTASSVVAQDSQYMNILLAENRTQNSELRMNISKLETKIEKVLDKIDILNSKSGDEKRDNKEDEVLALEEQLLDLKKTNRSLRVQLQELADKKQQTAVAKEDFSEFEKLLEKYKIDYTATGSASDVHKQLIRTLASEIDNVSCLKTETARSLENTKSQLHEATDKLNESQRQQNDLQKRYDEDIATFRGELATITTEKENLLSQLENMPSTDVLVKEIMNNLYQRLTEEFDKKSNFTAVEVQKICANAIKIETNNVIKAKWDNKPS